ASAASRCVRVAEREARSHHRVHIIDLNSIKVLARKRINEDPQPTVVDDLVALTRPIFDLHGIGESATASGHNSDSKASLIAGALCFQELLDLTNGGFS